MNKNVLNEKEAAQRIGMSVSYLQHARSDGRKGNRTPGPAYVKLGRTVRYRVVDLDGWVEDNVIGRRM